MFRNVLLGLFLFFCHFVSSQEVFRSLLSRTYPVAVRSLEFVENKGQWHSDVWFRSQLAGADMWLERQSVMFVVFHPQQMKEFSQYKTLSYEERQRWGVPSGLIDAFAFRIQFQDANVQAQPIAENQLSHYYNFFLGNDPSRWASEVKVFATVKYDDIYTGIDCVIGEQDGLLKFDFHLEPGAEVHQIRLRFEGVKRLNLAADGSLRVHLPFHSVQFRKPFAYQRIDGKVFEVFCEYRIINKRTIGFSVGKYDSNYPLIIDPVWVFGSYTGSTADNWGYTATYDADGNLYTGGSVFNVGYPVTPGAFQINFAGGVCDVSISKFNPSGTSLIYSTYLGGSRSEVPHSLIVSRQNEMYVYGSTGSSDFPIATNHYDASFNGGTAYTLTNIIQFPNGSDIFIARFNSTGTQLLSSTYLGGSGNDGLNMYSPLKHNYADDCRGEILIDSQDNVYVVSTTASTNFPVTAGVFQPNYGGGELDGCIVKMDYTLTNLIWASYLGGSGIDAIYSISFDRLENLIVAGGTTSTNFPTTPGVVRPNYQGGSCDGFVARISKNGDQLIRSTYWGTSYYDQVYFVEADKQNNIYLLGQTRDPNSTLRINAQWWMSGGGVFISKLNFQLSSIVWSTVFGTGNGIPNISPTAFLVDYCKNIYLSGWGSYSLNGFGGTSGLPITSNALQHTTDNNDYYFMAIASDASSLTYATYYGGSSAEHVDGGTSRFDRMGKIYQSVCAGCGGWSDFPTTPGAWSNTNNSTNCNNGVIKIDFQIPAIVADFTTNSPVCLPAPVVFTNQSYMVNPGQTSCYWDFGDGQTSTDCNPVHVYSSPGVYDVMLVISDLTSCNQADTVWHQVLVMSNSTSTLPEVHMCAGDAVQIGIPPYVGQGITYQWTPSTGLSNPNVPNPFCHATTTTTYTLIVNSGVCRDTLIQKVNVYNITADAGSDTSICLLTHTLVGSGFGAPDLMYHWSSNNQFTNWLNTSPSEPAATVQVPQSSWFYLLVYNDWCSAVDSVFIDKFNISSSITSTQPLCHDDCNGSITVVPLNGNAPYQYLWSTGQNSQTIDGLCAGQYQVTITDADSCQTVVIYDLGQPDPLSLNFAVNHIPCEDACIGRILVAVSGGTPSYQFSWSNGQTQGMITNLCSGEYSLTVTDHNNCVISDTVQINVNYIYQNVQVTSSHDTIWEGQTAQFTATYIPGVQYTWNPSQWLSNPNGHNTYVSPPPGTYWYYVTLNDGNGCIYTDSVKITVIDVYCYPPYLFIPTGFTPDGDGVNDVFYVRGIYIDQMEMRIFDRWGNLIFESYRQEDGWDGTYKGKPCPPDVYAVYVKILCFNKLEYFYKGNVTLIR